MRILIKFTKESEIKFISHLDLMRTIQKVIKRSDLPVKYSAGFNPHMETSLAQPLSVGMYSESEYMDVEFTDWVDETEIIEKLNASAPIGIRFIKAVYVESDGKKLPQAMAIIDAAEYKICIKYNNVENLNSEVTELLASSEWMAEKKSKKGSKEVNIKDFIKSFNYKIDENVLKINTTISCGSRETLSAKLLADYVASHTSHYNSDAFIDIERLELYGYKGDKLVPLYKFFE